MGLVGAAGRWWEHFRTRTRSFGLPFALRWAVWHFGYSIPYKLLGVDSVTADPVFDEEWDVLVLLDACRYDAARRAQNRHRWLSGVESRWSVGGTSTQWMDRTFDDPSVDLSDVGYVTGNPYSETHVDESAFAFVDEVWRDAWDDETGTIRARPVTDRAIEAARTRDADRLIVHYMQPHFPSVPTPITSGLSVDGFGDDSMSVWDDIAEGRITVDEARDAYRANLDYVLDDVELLLSNVDADTVAISADHGEAFGEHGVFGHDGSALPAVRRVPWVEASATDTGDHDPADHERADVSSSVEDRLQQLGYAE
ncbi:hypothetical protein [Candidatus Halobonum tyrrellensis]|uniref:Sulfatase n=1 Tax=Candidatus Halobonum tyrrellensis G22 TaxID=1324957 RepID=V4HH24_9EURY|nr:hypothetical protein [Candidatus Halobonum tyrrellensis]ESP90035.1 hypothetical protein K933_00692 [Candidatus Halobonum tyrrellensis G22]